MWSQNTLVQIGLTDGANSAGIGFLPYQNLDGNNPGKNVTIVAANSSGLKDSQLSYSPVDCELLALRFATEACNYFLYGAAEVNVFTDCSALEGMFSKPMADIKNKRQRTMIENMQWYNLKFTHNKVPKMQLPSSYPA